MKGSLVVSEFGAVVFIAYLAIIHIASACAENKRVPTLDNSSEGGGLLCNRRAVMFCILLVRFVPKG